MRKKRAKKYKICTTDQKLDAVAAIRMGADVTSVSKDLGVSRQAVADWVKKIKLKDLRTRMKRKEAVVKMKEVAVNRKEATPLRRQATEVIPMEIERLELENMKLKAQLWDASECGRM